MSKTVLLIDGENILHQSFHKFEKLHSTDGKPSGAIYGFFKSLHGYIIRFNPDKVIITFDNGHSPFRVNLNPNYKIHRKDISFDRESLQAQKAIILKILGMLRITYVFDKKKNTNYEGDDFLAYIALKEAKNQKVLIVSSDKDFNQLLDNHNIKIYNTRKDTYINYSNCKEQFEYSPEETVPYLCMVGDKSDDIPGIKGIGPVKARKILDEHPIDKDFWDYIKSTFSPEDRMVINKNIKLIDLRVFLKKVPLKKLPIKKYTNTTLKIDKFKELCIEYSFSSFMTNNFMKPFEELNYEH